MMTNRGKQNKHKYLCLYRTVYQTNNDRLEKEGRVANPVHSVEPLLPSLVRHVIEKRDAGLNKAGEPTGAHEQPGGKSDNCMMITGWFGVFENDDGGSGLCARARSSAECTVKRAERW